MGGMIAQLAAIRHPNRVLTLTSIMSTTGDPNPPRGDPAVVALLTKPAPAEREAAIEHAVELDRACAGPGFEFDRERARPLKVLAKERDPDPAGPARQLLALMLAGSRKDALRSVAVPTLLIHGDADPLIPLAGGIDTAQAIPEAKMLVIEGLGHGLPKGGWPRIIDAIVELAKNSAQGSRRYAGGSVRRRCAFTWRRACGPLTVTSRGSQQSARWRS
jgi:pimeloyl-ACP methyl ester carboxylesterase